MVNNKQVDGRTLLKQYEDKTIRRFGLGHLKGQNRGLCSEVQRFVQNRSSMGNEGALGLRDGKKKSHVFFHVSQYMFKEGH
jgi:hypothetical protein